MTDIKVIIVDFKKVNKVLWRIDTLLDHALEIDNETTVC